MDLSSSVVNSLKVLGGEGESSFSNEQFKLLIGQVFDSFLIHTKAGDFSITFDNDALLQQEQQRSPAELKDATATLYTLIAELTKHDLDLNSTSTFLEDHGFTAEKIKLFLQHYENKKSLIRLFLTSSSTSFPHVVDISWRLDYVIKETNMERISEPVYLVELKVEKPQEDNLSTIQFSCTIEQLQDLVYKLRECTKALEKLTQLN